MPDTWHIRRLKPDGTFADAQTFEAVQIRNVRRRLANQNTDTLSVQFSGIRPPHIGGLKFGEIIRFFRNGQGWFTGRVVSPERSLTGSDESAALDLFGPWDDLGRIVYRQTGLYYVPAAEGDDGGLTVAGLKFATLTSVQLSSKVILGQDSTSKPLTAGETIDAAIAYALAGGARFQAAPNQAAGEAELAQTLPTEDGTDLTCADVIRRVLRWLPDVTCWFDYTTEPPSIRFKARAGRNAVTVAMGAGGQVVTARLRARPELVLPGVALQYLRPLEVTSADGTTTAANTLVLDTAGPSPYGLGALVATIELTGGALDAGTGQESATVEPVPSGLAALLYASRSSLIFSGAVALKDQEIVDGGNWVGRVLNVNGGDEEWTKMRAEIQGSEDQTESGATTLTVGPPEQLTAQDLAALLSANRRRTSPDTTDVSTRTGGTVTIPPSDPPPPPAPPPGSNPPGGYSGPPKHDPDNYENPNGNYTGIIEKYRGQTSVDSLGGIRFEDTGPPLGLHENHDIFSAAGGDPPTSAGNFILQGVGDGFYSSYVGSKYIRDNGANRWLTIATCVEEYSIGTLDLSAFTPLQYDYAELSGTMRTSRGDGHEDDIVAYNLPVSGFLGQRCHNFRVYHPVGQVGSHNIYKGSGSGSKESSATLSLTTLRLLPKGKT